MSTPSEFSRKMKRISVSVGPRIEARVQEIGILVLQGVVFATPVDTGRARGNWQVGINQVKLAKIDRKDKSGQATFSAGVSDIQGYSIEAHGFIAISNNLPYIVRLNEGHSKRQQPVPGWIDRAVLAAQTTIEQASLLK